MLGTRYTVDSDGDVEMSIPQPIFEVIRPQSFQAGSMQRSFTGTVSGNATLRRYVTAALFMARRLKTSWQLSRKPMSSVTDTDIMDSVVERCGTLKNDFVPDLTAMFNKQLKMDLSIDDCDARIFRYFEDFNGIIADNGLRHLIGTDNESEDGYKNRMKTRCRLLVENLQPSVLKAQIVRLIDLEKYKIMMLEGIPSLRYPNENSNAPSTQAPRPPRSLPHDGCLHCKGGHWLKDCLTATVAQQAEAREKFQEAKEKRSSAIRSKAAKYATPSGSVRINGLIEVAYIPDTGADKSIILQGVVESLHDVHPLLSSTLLSTNMEVVMAVRRRLMCEQEVLLNLELMTIAGPVSIRSVPCLVLSGGGDEVVLGRDVFKGLGIDVEEQLAQLAGPLSLDRDMDEFPAGDSIPDTQDAQEPITTLSQLLDRAVANGLPTEHVDAVEICWNYFQTCGVLQSALTHLRRLCLFGSR
ncbi:hypothetical protein PC129_g19903 [Phytophthora cactorum]|uniref:Uncharacterized protein n=1 Tax=Phytophthora cactorum TaxID=29920 RepID=A0A8T1BP79_9STRA|nr:hypothetical protein PC113_g9340 [Phytophthora cactorum]KAG2906545.1 hypothetical protein PC117_g20473 [Phytophthora cactorum]KAG3165988.1 hypothetical protein C6341_g12187 [Phytophthora cactorum]KAG3209077.1 hypothetical protein PC129_g19903 [Phytophthora cactorum]